MKCKLCGGQLEYADGFYVCANCANRFPVADFYEKHDAYICYTETDSSGRRTKDSVIAQDIYATLKRAKISAFYARISVADSGGDAYEQACNAALHGAQIVVLVGSNPQFFEQLLEKHADLLGEKTVIPVCIDMPMGLLPKKLQALQVLDYGKIGAGVDLVKSIQQALNRKPDKAAAYLNGRKPGKLLWISLAAIAVLLVAAIAFFAIAPKTKESAATEQTTQSVQTTADPALAMEAQYIQAMAYADSGAYGQAIDLFVQLQDYKDSSKQLGILYQHYAGYYKNEAGDMTFRLQVQDGKAGIVEFSKITAEGAYCTITEVFQLEGTRQEIAFNDSENNQGTLCLELCNAEILVAVNTEKTMNSLSIGNVSLAFLLSEKSDKPFAAAMDAALLLGWLHTKTTFSQLRQQGYVLEFEQDFNGAPYHLYRIKNTDIRLLMSRRDPETMDHTDDLVVTAISTAAARIIPDKIGAANAAFVLDEVLYVPDGKINVNVGLGVYFGFPEEIAPKAIEESTPVCFICSKSLGEDITSIIKFYS